MQTEVKSPPPKTYCHYLDNPFLRAHLRKQQTTDGDLFDFVLFSNTVNGKPGMRVAGQGVLKENLAVSSATPEEIASTPCSFAHFCHFSDCPFLHPSWYTPCLPCSNGPQCTTKDCPRDHRPGLRIPKGPFKKPKHVRQKQMPRQKQQGSQQESSSWTLRVASA